MQIVKGKNPKRSGIFMAPVDSIFGENAKEIIPRVRIPTPNHSKEDNCSLNTIAAKINVNNRLVLIKGFIMDTSYIFKATVYIRKPVNAAIPPINHIGVESKFKAVGRTSLKKLSSLIPPAR